MIIYIFIVLNSYNSYLSWYFFIIALQCPAGMLFQQCGRLCPQVCGAPAVCNGGCAEGCFCPDGQVSDSNGQCVEPSSCPGECSTNKNKQTFLIIIIILFYIL